MHSYFVCVADWVGCADINTEFYIYLSATDESAWQRDVNLIETVKVPLPTREADRCINADFHRDRKIRCPRIENASAKKDQIYLFALRAEVNRQRDEPLKFFTVSRDRFEALNIFRFDAQGYSSGHALSVGVGGGRLVR
jgi:hypothetical protein